MSDEKLTKPVVEELIRIKHQHPVFMAWLEARRIFVRQTMVYEKDEVALRHWQGKAQELDDLLDLIQRSPDTLTKWRA